MKHADDTGFYCYRAIESLRHHCAAVNSLTDESKTKQWERFREVAGCDEQILREIKAAADPLRHGQIVGSTSADRERLFTITWDIVDSYLLRFAPDPESPAIRGATLSLIISRQYSHHHAPRPPKNMFDQQAKATA